MVKSSGSGARIYFIQPTILMTILIGMMIPGAVSFILPSSHPMVNTHRHYQTQRPTSCMGKLNDDADMLRAVKMLPGLLLPMFGAISPAFAFDQKGAKLFETNCVSCHVGGGNVIG